jgi:CHAD domain-containing protein
MGSWWRRGTVLLPIVEKSNEPFNNEEIITENTSLLAASGNSSNPKNDKVPLLCSRQQLHVNNKQIAALVTLLLAAAICIMPLVFRYGAAPHSSNETPPWWPPPVLSKKFAPVLVDNDFASNMTFRELARVVLPAAYRNMLPMLSIFNKSVMPEDVYKTRKALLKTRDLLDVFSPVYPNSTMTASKGEDVWLSLRFYLDEGYTVVGEFLDLFHSHVNYSQALLDDTRDQVLKWTSDFAKFRHRHNVPAFLANATVNCSVHHIKESRFFWKSLKQERARGGDPARQSLHLLGSKQLDLVLYYMRLVHPFRSVLNGTAHDGTIMLQNLLDLDGSFHENYHNCRKAMRAVTDEFDLFGSIMFLNSSKTDAAIGVLKMARGLLGDINDDWTAYSIYVEDDEFLEKQTMLAEKINNGWANFTNWAAQANFEGSVRYLSGCMNSTIS